MAPPGTGGSNGAGQKRKADDDDGAPIILTKTAPYDPSHEQAPKSVTLSNEWQTFVDGKKKIRTFLMQPMKMCEYRDEIVEGLIRRIDDRITNAAEQKIIIGFAGAMGSGKSSTLNSLYQAGMVAREGDSGGSCTLVTHIYQDRMPDQQTPFQATVHFLNRADRRAILASYLCSYYRASTGGDEDENGLPISSGEDDQEDFDVKKHIADAMAALFYDHPECKTSTNAARFLDQAESEDDAEILAQLFDWADGLARRTCGANSYVTVTASTGTELLEYLQYFSTDMEDDDGLPAQSLWPLVSHINIHFEDPITRLGINVVDSPGTTDANRVRRTVALEHRKLRTHAILVADAARAKDDPTIAKEIKSMKSKGSDRLVIALPKADKIGDTTKLEGSRRNKEIVAGLKEKVIKLENDLNATNCQMAAAASETARNAFAAKTIELDVRLKLAQNAVDAQRIRMRSEITERSLQETYRSITENSSPVAVLSISNEAYKQHLAGFYPKQTPVLSLEESRIPELRRFIYSAPNEARKNEAKFQFTTVLPGLFSHIKFYINRTPMARKADLERHVRKPLEEFERHIDDVFKVQENSMIEHITSKIKALELGWLKKAEKLCDKWARELKSGPHLTLMKRDGRRAGRGKTTEVNMTADLIEIHAQNVHSFFSKAMRQNKQLHDDLLADLEALHSSMVTQMQCDSNASFVVLRPFYDYVGNEKGRINTAVRNASARLLDVFDEVLKRLTFENEDSYLVQAMLPIYAEAATYKGGKGGTTKFARPKIGWPNYRKSYFKQAVCKPQGLWKEACDRAEGDLIEALYREKQTVTREIGAVFNDFLVGFDTMCAAKAVDDPAEKQLRELMKEGLELAEQHLNGPMRRAKEGLERNF